LHKRRKNERKGFLTLNDFSVEQIESIFELALELKANPDHYEDSLPQMTMAMILKNHL